MKYSKLNSLFARLSDANALDRSNDVINITDLMSLQLSGGDDPVGTFNDTGCTNASCVNNSCATGDDNFNTSCSNSGCTGNGNKTCNNTGCHA